MSSIRAELTGVFMEVQNIQKSVNLPKKNYTRGKERMTHRVGCHECLLIMNKTFNFNKKDSI